MANRSLGALTVDLLLKMGGFKAGSDKAQRELDKLAKDINAKVARITNGFKAAGKVFATFGVGFGVAGGIAGITRAAAEAIKYGDAIKRASEKSGIAAGTLSQLAVVAENNEVALDSLATSIGKMQKSISEAGSGSESALLKFQALGIEFENFKKLAPDKQFEVLADQINKLKDPADRARAAVEIFGKAGADLLPLFSQGADGIRKAREEVVRLGGALTTEQVEKLAAADDAVDRLSTSWSGFARTLTSSVAPALAKVFDELNRVLGGKTAQQREAEIESLLKSRIPAGATRDALQLELARINEEQRRGLLGSSGRQATRGASSVVAGDPVGFAGAAAAAEAAKNAAKEVNKLTRAQIAGISELVVTAREITTSATEQLYRDMDAATQTSMERQLAQWEEFDAQVATLVGDNIISAQEGAARIAENNASFLEPIEVTAERIVLKAQETTKQISEFAREASANLQDLFAEFLFDPFDKGLDGMIKGFADTLQRMAAQAASAQIMKYLFGSSIGSGEGVLGGLFAGFFADGGFVKPGQFAIAGEAGPEVIFGGKSGVTVTPMAKGGGNTYNISVPISAPTGTISRSTEMQVAAAAARGARMADTRNN